MSEEYYKNNTDKFCCNCERDIKKAYNDGKAEAPAPSGRDLDTNITSVSECKAQGFDEWWNNHAPTPYYANETVEREMAAKAFLAGHANALAQSKAATLKLPEKKCNRYDETDDLISTSEVATHNSLLDKIIRLNPEFKILIVLDAVKSMNERE